MATRKATKPRAANEGAASGATALDYDAVKATGRRRAPASGTIKAEHVVLPESKRRQMLATVQDQIRNASTAAWMVRRHLDYVSRFKMQFRTREAGEKDNSPRARLDRLVTRLFQWHAQPDNFDIAGRFGREEAFRMFEAEKVTAGDAGLVFLADGHLQAIESDLIAYPKAGKWNKRRGAYDAVPQNVVDSVGKDTGMVMDERRPGRIAQFCICNRGENGKSLAFDHLEDAANVLFDGYWTRFSSQVRGVSPLSTAINTIQDSYEGIDFNLAKAKVHALFGLALMRDYSGAGSDQDEVNEWGGASGLRTGAHENEVGASQSDDGTKAIAATAQELKPNEMMIVDMDLKGRLDTIESKTPSNEFREFQELVLRLAFLALDIPYTAFNSRAASFAGMIADQNLYEVSCKWKREKNLWARKRYSDWLLALAWNDPTSEWGLREVANEAGFTRLRDLQEEVEWVASGFPWLQKLNEVQGDIKAIGALLDNPIDACRRRGVDVFANIDKTAQVYAYAKEKGVAVMIGEPGQVPIDGADEREEAKQQETEDE